MLIIDTMDPRCNTGFPFYNFIHWKNSACFPTGNLLALLVLTTCSRGQENLFSNTNEWRRGPCLRAELFHFRLELCIVARGVDTCGSRHTRVARLWMCPNAHVFGLLLSWDLSFHVSFSYQANGSSKMGGLKSCVSSGHIAMNTVNVWWTHVWWRNAFFSWHFLFRRFLFTGRMRPVEEQGPETKHCIYPAKCPYVRFYCRGFYVR